jgi:aldose 1-epimerase
MSARRADQEMDMPLVTMRSESLEVEVLPEVGARIHRLRAFGYDLIRTPPDLAKYSFEPFYWGAFPLIPWSNRIPKGQLVFRGQTYYVGENTESSAIHGEAYGRPWRAESPGVFGFAGGHFGFPWPYRAEQRYELSDATLALNVSVSNHSAVQIPAGLGIHPWWDASSPLLVSIPATLTYPLVDEIPSGDPQPVEGELDLRALQAPAWGLDNLWTGLTGRSITLEWPDRRIRVDFGFSAESTHVVLASRQDFQAVAIEPVTHATNGFNLLEQSRPGAIGVLAPGESLEVAYTISVSQL